MLCVLLLRLSAVSANSGSTLRRTGCCLLRDRPWPTCGPKLRLTGLAVFTPACWRGGCRKQPFLPVCFFLYLFRAVIWIIALIWMGTACILNARRCNRTHCRYTGPYYLAMIVPVVVLGIGVVSAGIYGWISLGVIIVGGSGLIWWATERTWGKFS